MGRTFTNNVPLHRRGDRERMLREQFIQELDPKGESLHVCMGDLFDKTNVSLDTIMFVADEYIKAADNNLGTDFCVLRGNHDKGRDLTTVTAFDVFTALVKGVDNLHVIDEFMGDDHNHLYLGWHPEKTAEQVLQEALDYFKHKDFHTVFGHWDVDERSPSFNLIPTKLMAKHGIKKAYTGHDHRAREFTRDGVDVVVTGSMSGYAHGEGHPYVTLTLDELKSTDVTDLCVRLRLKKGEVLDEIPNCLQWQVEVEKEEGEPIPQVEMGSFNLSGIYDRRLGAREIVKPVRDKVDIKWQETFSKQD